MTDRVIMGANWWIDTLNCRKRLDSVALPRLNKTMDRFVNGGGWTAIAIPGEIEELTAPVTMKGAHEDVRSLFGREPGDWSTFTYYERLRDIMAGKNLGRVVTLRGLLNEVQQPRVTGKKAEMTTYTFGTIVNYKDMVNGNVIHEIDFDNNTLIINGTDYSAEANRLIAA